MNCITLAAVTLLTLGDVQVLHKNGNTMEGRVVNVSTEFVVIETAEGESRFARDDIQSVVNDDVTSEQPVGEPIRIQLRDNSVLWSPRLNVNGQNAVVAVEGRKLEVPLPKIHYVRLKNRKENDSRWKEILSRRARADSIVVQGPEELEALDGVLGNVTDSHVTFEFDGDSIDVKRPKVGGFIYYLAKQTQYPKTPCIVSCAQGSILHAEKIELAKDSTVEITTGNGVTLKLNWDSIRQVDFADTDSVFLSDLEPESFSGPSTLTAQQQLPEFQSLYQPTRDVNFFGEALQIRIHQAAVSSEVFEKGMSIQNNSRVTYRLAGEYRRFEAIAGIDARFVPSGSVRLRFMGDGTELFSKQISGADDATEIDIDLSTVKRLTIEVDRGKETSEGGHLNLCHARLSR